MSNVIIIIYFSACLTIFIVKVLEQSAKVFTDIRIWKEH